MNKYTRYFLCCLTAFFLPIHTYADTNTKNWEFEIAPYLWATSLDGTVNIGRTHAQVDQSFSDIFKHLDIGGMLWAKLRYKRFGIYFNGLYAALSDNAQFRRVSIRANDQLGILGAGFSYTVYDKTFANHGQLQLEPYLGVRYTFNDTQLKLNQFTFALNKAWYNPVLGLQTSYLFTPKWLLTLFTDVGGTNTTTDYSYNISAILGFKPASFKSTRFDLGYRYLYQRYETGSGRNLYVWNMRLFGPVLGVTFAF